MNAEVSVAGLDDGFQRVGERIEDVDLRRCIARKRAEAARRVADGNSRRQPHRPRSEPLQRALERRHVRRFRHFAIADHHLRASADDRRNQAGDVAAGVLIVRIGVDDDVRAESQGGVDAGGECGRKSAMRLELQDVRRSRFSRRVGSVVRTSVVDDEGLD